MDGQVVVADLLGNAPEWQERALCAQTDPEAGARAIGVIRQLVDKGTVTAERIDQSYQRIMRLKQRLAS